MDIIESALIESYTQETFNSPFSVEPLLDILKSFKLKAYCISIIPHKKDIILRVDYRLKENLHTIILSTTDSIRQELYPTAKLFITSGGD